MSPVGINEANPTLTRTAKSEFDTPIFNETACCVECTDVEQCANVEGVPVCARCFEAKYNEDWSRKEVPQQVNRLAAAVTVVCIAVVFYTLGLYTASLTVGGAN